MVVKTKCFGEIDITEDKVITFENGLFGFEQFTKFTILFNNEKEGNERISWLQSMEEPSLALPMIQPFVVMKDYQPSVANESLKWLEPLSDENMAMFVIVTVPGDVKKMTANLKAPIVINSDTRKAAQVVADNAEYKIKHEIYEILTSKEGQSC